jgi:Lrp/AsnC family transcriptional regulator, regulator for asnA, asnC and gidA
MDSPADWEGKTMDALDIDIISELQKDGRTPNVQLAQQLNVVEGTVRKRINQLIKDNIIEVVAVPNMQKLGYNFSSIMGFQVRIEDLKNVAAALAKSDHVCYLAWVAGQFSLIAIIMAKTPEEFCRFEENELALIPGIVRTESFVNLTTLKGSLPLFITSGLVSQLSAEGHGESA